MYDDLLGEKRKEIPEESKDSIIDAMRDNIEAKEQMISDLLDRVTELERQIEFYESKGDNHV